ncbi:hypothetical protein CALCODRAFT_60380 [Calocera cornea HHB12733]|uniref:Uncharacterized protein n=1 Tax=Calocera cornea HHB12733 TaxID=1353952 RepID=A0A165DP05_9BASI|nr:hypothetical protein CALCODRAFT_60380 [Calocera cornea HHB12733]
MICERSRWLLKPLFIYSFFLHRTVCKGRENLLLQFCKLCNTVNHVCIVAACPTRAIVAPSSEMLLKHRGKIWRLGRTSIIMGRSISEISTECK